LKIHIRKNNEKYYPLNAFQYHLFNFKCARVLILNENTMPITLEYTRKQVQTQKTLVQQRWQRITLLSVLGYEAAGCLAGGSLLIAEPNGRLMDMPVDIMHGVFSDFLIPGIILLGLGILNTVAFIAVLRRTKSGWITAGLALAGLAVWFWVEIVILQGLHWLHAMWGLPVIVGGLVAFPLVPDRQTSIRKVLLLCGMLSSLYYVALNIFVPMQWDEYSIASQTVSELSAINAPTRPLWVGLCILYVLLFAAFGWGVLKSAEGKRPLRIMGVLIIVYSVFNLYWPPMHLRGNEPSLTDALHITWAMVTLLLMMLMMGFGAAALGKRFRLFTIATFVVFIVFGILIGVEAPGIPENLPTPRIGIWERINIGVFMLWVVVFASALLLREQLRGSIKKTNNNFTN
jgi:hypothetical protein